MSDVYRTCHDSLTKCRVMSLIQQMATLKRQNGVAGECLIDFYDVRLSLAIFYPTALIREWIDNVSMMVGFCIKKEVNN